MKTSSQLLSFASPINFKKSNTMLAKTNSHFNKRGISFSSGRIGNKKLFSSYNARISQFLSPVLPSSLAHCFLLRKFRASIKKTIFSFLLAGQFVIVTSKLEVASHQQNASDAKSVFDSGLQHHQHELMTKIITNMLA